MPSGGSPCPFAFGIKTRGAGSGLYVFLAKSARTPANNTATPASSIAANVTPSTRPCRARLRHNVHPQWRGRADRRVPECRRGKTCRTEQSSGKQASC